jgi:hypothetical protein
MSPRSNENRSSGLSHKFLDILVVPVQFLSGIWLGELPVDGFALLIPLGKRNAIAAIDSELGPLVAQVESGADLLVVVTGDHATPSSGPLIHSGEAVPLLIAGGPNVLADEVTEFHERAAIRGGLGRVYGTDLMPILLNLTDRVRLHGVRHQRQTRPYWQWRPEPFTVALSGPSSKFWHKRP